MKPAQLLAAVVALSSVSAAWPDVFDNSNALAPLKNVIYGRQDNPEEPQKTEPAKPASTGSDQPKETGDSKESPKPTGSDPTPTGKDEKETPTGKDKDKAKTTTKVKSIPPDRPAGGIQMITPGPLAGPQYYKIGEWVTFAWNYTSLSVTPDAIDVLATCTLNQATYTIAVNQTVEETGRVLWNTSKDKDGNNPLLTDMYTLLIYDSQSSVSAMPKPGYLGVSNTFRFGLYMPQKAVDIKDFECPNCNGAMGTLTLNALFITTSTTVGSLIYFAYTFGVF